MSTPGFYVWEWEDEKGQKNAYGATTSLALDEAHQNAAGTVDTEAWGRKYSIDVAKMEKTNVHTKVVRKVVRKKDLNVFIT